MPCVNLVKIHAVDNITLMCTVSINQRSTIIDKVDLDAIA